MPPKEAALRDQRPLKSRPGSSPVKNTYLLAYNAVSAALWAGVLYKTVTIGAHEIQTARKAGSFFGRNDLQSAAAGLASGKVFGELDEYTRLVQSLAGLEVLHSLVGTLPSTFRNQLEEVEYSRRLEQLLIHAQASCALLSSQPLCKSHLASSSSGALHTISPPPPNTRPLTAPCCWPGPSPKLYATATSSSPSPASAYPRSSPSCDTIPSQSSTRSASARSAGWCTRPSLRRRKWMRGSRMRCGPSWLSTF